MADFLQGQTFGTTEQVTNTKLHNLVVNASISNIKASEMSNSFLTSLASSHGIIPSQNIQLGSLTTLSGYISTYNLPLGSLTTISGLLNPRLFSNIANSATNASIINVALNTAVNLYWSVAGTLATFTGMHTGHVFTLLAKQASYPVIVDTGNFLLSANWIPQKAGDNLTLIWDGTNFVEISRVAT